MGAFQAIAPKYLIRASFTVEGVVEKSDVIGALFGQTEGLFGPDLDLHELQKTGRIGRIEIEVASRKDKTSGTIVVPSSLDKSLTTLIAAVIESVDRVGPCAAKVKLEKIEDIRDRRRKEIIDRAKGILHNWVIEEMPTMDEVADEISKVVIPPDVIAFGPDRLAAGPEVEKSPSIVIVEGRADVINLLRAGIKNAIACEGTNISDTVVKLSRGKEVTALLDGDRGGDIILEALLRIAKVDYVAKAPRGTEVEELTPRQILRVLEQKVPVSELREEKERERERRAAREEVEPPQRPTAAVPDAMMASISELQGSLEAIVFDSDLKVLERMPVSELAARLQKIENAHTVVFDGVITQRLVDVAEEKGVKRIIGDRISGVAKRPVEVQLLTVSDITGN